MSVEDAKYMKAKRARFKEPAIWSVIIAAAAVVLSQLPPVADLLRGVRVRLSVPEYVQMSHYLGNVQLQLFVDIHNSGGLLVDISDIDTIVTTSDGKMSWRLPARSYYARQLPNPTGQWLEFPIGTIVLQPGTVWSELVRCYRAWDQEEEATTNDIIASIRNDIQQKLANRPPSNPFQPMPPPVVASDNLVDAAQSFFIEKFDLHPGAYELYVALASVLPNGERKLLVVRGFTFVLLESHIKSLIAQTEGYRYGAGIYFPVLGLEQIANIRLEPMGNEQAQTAYEKLQS